MITKIEFINKFAELMKLVLYINAETDTDIFVHFSGHVDSFDIHYDIDGYENRPEATPIEDNQVLKDNNICVYNVHKPYWVPFDGKDCNGSIAYWFNEIDNKIEELKTIANDKGLDLGVIYG